MEDFITWSGWLFGLVSVIIAVFQYLGKEKLKKQINNINNSSTTMTSGDGGVNVGKNSGGINIGK